VLDYLPLHALVKHPVLDKCHSMSAFESKGMPVPLHAEMAWLLMGLAQLVLAHLMVLQQCENSGETKERLASRKKMA
jgi:hypothetical protein